MKKFIFISTAALMNLLGLIYQASAQPFTYRVNMRSLQCITTTEQGEDEVYFVVNGKSSSGETFNYRYPNGAHWDMNDNGQNGWIGETVLVEAHKKLTINDYAVFNVILMEEDGGQLGSILIDKGIEMAAACGDPMCLAGGGALLVARALGAGPDADDYIGSFTIWLTKDKEGRIQVEYRDFNGCYAYEYFMQGVKLQFQRGRAIYRGDFQTIPHFGW